MTKSALCIDINDYPGTDSDLAGCVNDAADWAAELKRRGLSVGLCLIAGPQARIVMSVSELSFPPAVSSNPESFWFKENDEMEGV